MKASFTCHFFKVYGVGLMCEMDRVTCWDTETYALSGSWTNNPDPYLFDTTHLLHIKLCLLLVLIRLDIPLRTVRE